jgi:hypothetical protein
MPEKDVHATGLPRQRNTRSGTDEHAGAGTGREGYQLPVAEVTMSGFMVSTANMTCRFIPVSTADRFRLI